MSGGHQEGKDGGDESSLSRRSLLRGGVATAALGVSGCNGSSGDSALPLAITRSHPAPLVRDVDNVFVFDVSVTEQTNLGSLFGPKALHEADVFVAVDGATVSRVLPGDFPRNVVAQRHHAGGVAVDTPWRIGRHATFGLVVRPTASTVSVRLALGGRLGPDGEYHEVEGTYSLEATTQPSATVTPERLAGAAARRSTLAGHFERILARQSTFDDRAVDSIRQAMLGVCIGSTRMLADTAFAETLAGLGLLSGPGAGAAAEYLWEAYTLHFTSPFESSLDGEVPADPTAVDPTAEQFAPPFMTELLTAAGSLFDDFVEFVQYYDPEAATARNAAIVQFRMLSVLAREEAAAWRDGNTSVARQALANQAYVLSGHDEDADRAAVENLFDEHEALGGFTVDSYTREARNLVQKLFVTRAKLRGSLGSREQAKRVEPMVRSIHEVTAGEAQVVHDLLAYVDTELFDPLTFESKPSLGWRHVRSDQTRILVGIAAVDDDVVLGGRTKVDGAPSGSWFTRLDSDGVVVWDREYPDGQIAEADVGGTTHGVVGFDGGVAFVSEVRLDESQYSRIPRLTALDADGRVRWQWQWQRNDPDRRVFSLRRTEDGFLLAGEHWRDDSARIWAALVDESGNAIWTVTSPESSFRYRPVDAFRTDDGGALVVGQRWLSEERGHLTGDLTRIDPEGTVVWNRRLESSSVSRTRPAAAAAIASGYVLCGTGNGTSGTRVDWALVLDEDGEQRAWRTVTESHRFGTVIPAGDGALLVDGFYHNDGSDHVPLTATPISLEGELGTERTAEFILEPEYALSVGGGALVVGWAFLPDGELRMARLDSEGELMWSGSFGLPFEISTLVISLSGAIITPGGLAVGVPNDDYSVGSYFMGQFVV